VLCSESFVGKPYFLIWKGFIAVFGNVLLNLNTYAQLSHRLWCSITYEQTSMHTCLHTFIFNSIQFIDHFYSPPLSKVHYGRTLSCCNKNYLITHMNASFWNSFFESYLCMVAFNPWPPVDLFSYLHRVTPTSLQLILEVLLWLCYLAFFLEWAALDGGSCDLSISPFLLLPRLSRHQKPLHLFIVWCCQALCYSDFFL